MTLPDFVYRSVNYQTGNGATAVYLACQEGQYDILEFLIRMRRGNAIIKAYDGMSCLHAAAQSGHLDCVQFLVSIDVGFIQLLYKLQASLIVKRH